MPTNCRVTRAETEVVFEDGARIVVSGYPNGGIDALVAAIRSLLVVDSLSIDLAPAAG